MENRNQALTAKQLELKFNAGDEVEKRSFTTTFERSGEGAGRTIYGYAAVYEQETDMGWYIEKIERGAFDDAIAVSDVRALFNHKSDLLLARQSSGTLKLELDEKGLKYEFDAPDTSVGNDVLVLIERGDLKESSFAFVVEEQEWREVEKDGEVTYYRTIKKVKELYDVSPVTYPAYSTTTVAKRSFEEYSKQAGIVEDEVKNQANPGQREGRDARILAVIFS